MAKQNCWEFKKCGRQPGGEKAAELGICPAATEARTDGMNEGTNGGRVCWVIAGTLCGNEVQGTYAMKLGNCVLCEFYKQTRKEHGTEFKTGKSVLDKLKQ